MQRRRFLAGLAAAGVAGAANAFDPARTILAQATATQPRSPDVIFVPTPNDVVNKMLEMARVTAKDVVYDLGCGDGRIVITAAQKYGARGVGIDIDPQRRKSGGTQPRKVATRHSSTTCRDRHQRSDSGDLTLTGSTSACSS
jgi:predicted RNA methylase